jgi:hypothetical protein
MTTNLINNATNNTYSNTRYLTKIIE